MKKEYKGKEARPEMVVEFESDRIDVDIPSEDATVKECWKILPLTPPVVCCSIIVYFHIVLISAHDLRC